MRLLYHSSTLWAPTRNGDLLQIPGAGDFGGGRRMADMGEEILPGKQDLE